jgi:hypothetical protein
MLREYRNMVKRKLCWLLKLQQENGFPEAMIIKQMPCNMKFYQNYPSTTIFKQLIIKNIKLLK